MTEQEVLALIKSGEEFTIEVKSFEKYNPDNTRDWIKLHHDWLTDAVLVRLPITCRLLFITLCSLRGSKGGPLRDLTGTSLVLLTNLRGTSLGPHVVTLWKHGLIFVDKNRIDKKEKRSDKKRKREEDCGAAKKDELKVHPELAGTEAAVEIIRRAGLTPKVQDRKFELYGSWDFLRREFIKMVDWLERNPGRSPKSHRGWRRFISTWLERGWEKYRTSPAPPKAPPKIDHDGLWRSE